MPEVCSVGRAAWPCPALCSATPPKRPCWPAEAYLAAAAHSPNNGPLREPRLLQKHTLPLHYLGPPSTHPLGIILLLLLSTYIYIHINNPHIHDTLQDTTTCAVNVTYSRPIVPWLSWFRFLRLDCFRPLLG